MQETANILNHATDKSLVIMDEIGRGTSTFDGLSIAWAVAEFIHDLNDGTGVKTLFATHYHELTQLAQQKERIKNFHIAVKEWNEEIIFIRKLVQGGTNRSYGIQVARLAGIPDKVLNRSKKILADIEKEERPVHRISAAKDTRRPLDDRHVQLDLFHGPDNKYIREVKNLDLSRMTPLDAMNYLNAMQEKIKSGI
jgi:DNA mismatch repair protein MutS